MSRTQRLRKLETDTARLSQDWATKNRLISSTVTSLMPPHLIAALQSCISDWEGDLAAIEEYFSPLTHLLPHLAFDPDRNIHEAWIITIADAPQDVPLPVPPEGTAQFLFDRAAAWERIVFGHDAKTEPHQAALCQQGFFHYFGCLAQTVST